ncbi:MAG: C10 family peptidase [Bacteroidales bacterium]|nr:C10 family peptidase [Bacteroidales bacterium]
MRKQLLSLLVMLLGVTSLNAHPVDVAKAKTVGQKFVAANFDNQPKSNELQLVYTGVSTRNEACFYVFNSGDEGFVIVSADDRFRPIVGYSDEGPFATENMSPELAFYLDKIIEARTSPNVVLFDDTEQEWRSVMTTGRLISRNRGRAVDYICTTKWNQDWPYNMYAPEASSGSGGHCYAGCVATAMSQVMKRWDHPTQGTGSHSYYCPGYGSQSANFGQTTYHWELMPDRLSGASEEEKEAVALFMYHCGVSVDMGFSPSGSGANSWDVPDAINRYFSYSSHSTLKTRDNYSLVNWQNMLKESIDLGWPLYYSGYSNSGGHAFVCDGYDDNDLFHYNWGWGGSSDGWFVVDEIDYAGWAQAVFNYVPSDVYDYMPMQPENLSVTPSGNYDYAATLEWTNPTQDIHLNTINEIEQIVVTRNGVIVHVEENVTPGATMSYTDHYMPTMVRYAVYAVAHNAKGLEAFEDDVVLGPTCNWTVEMTSSDNEGWPGGYLSFVNTAGVEVAHLTPESTSLTRTVTLPLGHVDIIWKNPITSVGQMTFVIKNQNDDVKASFSGTNNDLNNGTFYIANNTCDDKELYLEGPQNLILSHYGNEVMLEWDAIERQAINYQVYRDNLLYAVTDNTSYTDTDATGVLHSYYVTAFTDEGETDRSNIRHITADIDCQAPANIRYEMTTPSKAKISWDAPQDGNQTGFMLYRRAKGEDFRRIKLLTNTFYTDNLTSQPNGCYEYAVSAYYSASDCESAYATAQDDPELNTVEVNKGIIPTHLSFYIHEGRVVLQWKEATMVDKYSIYRDGQRIGNSTSTDFVDFEATPSQSYRYTVTGRTAHIESSHSNEVFIDWTTDLNESVEVQEAILYPNPTSGMLFIEANGLQQVGIFNLMGQEVLRQTVSDGQANIDMSTLPEGTYFVKLIGEKNEIRKVVKIQ